MEEKKILEYKKYMRQMWKHAEEICHNVGVTDNRTIGLMFDKLCQPFYYWEQKQE